VTSGILQTPEELTGATIGGKAEGLLRLTRAGAPVPPWRVIPAEHAAARPWRHDEATREALRACFRELNTEPFQGVAVRSSACGEDSAESSLAGVFETRFAETEATFFAALDAVADGVDSARARLHTGPESTPMAIIVQAAVQPVLAGVLFSANPAAAHPEQCCIEAVHGHGAGLVDGTRAPSRFHVSIADGAAVSSETGADGPRELETGLIAELLGLLLTCETLFDTVVDIEWAVDAGGRVWLLQARPIITLSADPALLPPVCATSWFFDQRFLEPITPITRTTLLPIILRVAVEEALAMRRQPVPRPLFWMYGSQAYVAHEAHRRMFAGAPRGLVSEDLRQLLPAQCPCLDALSPRERNGARVYGDLRSGRWRGQETGHNKGQETGHNVGAFLSFAVTSLWTLLRHAPDALLNLYVWRRFRRKIERTLAALPPVASESPDAWLDRWRMLDALTLRFLRIHRWSLLWADYGYRIYRLLLRWMPRGWAAYVKDRLRTEMRLVTQAANRALEEVLAGHFREQGNPPDAAAHAAFLQRYGHRAASLDYAAPTWADLDREGRLCEVYGVAVPARAKATAKRRRGPLSVLLWPLRRALEMREEQRFTWERVLARQRVMLRDAAAFLATRGQLARRDDIWFLEWDEFRATLVGGATPDHRILTLRRHTARVEARFAKPPYIGPRLPSPEISDARVISGIGASPGAARGTVRVFAGTPTAWTPMTDHEETIAVLQALDPAWTILLPHVAGVVLERGGLLSHAALLAREYGVPMVVGVENATRLLRDGLEVTVDGVAGRVIVHDEDPAVSGDAPPEA